MALTDLLMLGVTNILSFSCLVWQIPFWISCSLVVKFVVFSWKLLQVLYGLKILGALSWKLFLDCLRFLFVGVVLRRKTERRERQRRIVDGFRRTILQGQLILTGSGDDLDPLTREMPMPNKESYLYVQTRERLCRLNMSKLCQKGSKRPEFKVVHNNSKGEVPFGMKPIVVDSKLYMIGGEKPKPRMIFDDSTCDENGFVPPEFADWLNKDVFGFEGPSLGLCKNNSFPRLYGPKTNPIVFTVGKKIYVLAMNPLFGRVYELFPHAHLFEVFNTEKREWKQLKCPPFYELNVDSSFYPVVYGFYAWGHKLVVYFGLEVYIFDGIDETWEVAKDLPRLWGAAEYKGFLIAMPFNQQSIVAHKLDSSGLSNSAMLLDDLQEIFDPPLPIKTTGFFNLLDDSGRMCFVYSGQDYSWRWWVRVAVFQVSVSTSSGNPVITAVLETVQHYDFQKFHHLDDSIYSAFVIYEVLGEESLHLKTDAQKGVQGAHMLVTQQRRIFGQAKVLICHSCCIFYVMSKPTKDLGGSSERDKVGPDYFGYYTSLVIELLSQENVFHLLLPNPLMSLIYLEANVWRLEARI